MFANFNQFVFLWDLLLIALSRRQKNTQYLHCMNPRRRDGAGKTFTVICSGISLGLEKATQGHKKTNYANILPSSISETMHCA
jgi:hypothetical protein